MKIYANRIKQLRNSRKMSQEEFATKIGVSRSTVGMYETGKREPDLETCEAIADFFNVDMDYLTGRSNIERRHPINLPDNPLSTIGERYTPKGQIPLLGRVAAGLPMYAEENIEGYIANDFDDGEVYYGLHVHGDSMSAAGIDDGDVVIVRQQDSVDTDQIAVVMVNGNDATIKYVQQQGDVVFLSPKSYNPVHQIQIYDLAKTPVRILGRVVQVRKSV